MAFKFQFASKQQFIYPFIHSFIILFLHPSIYVFIYSFIILFLHPFIYPSIYVFIFSLFDFCGVAFPESTPDHAYDLWVSCVCQWPAEWGWRGRGEPDAHATPVQHQQRRGEQRTQHVEPATQDTNIRVC